MKHNYCFSPKALIQTTSQAMDNTATKQLWTDVMCAKDLFNAAKQFDTDNGQAKKSTFIYRLLQSELLRRPAIVSSNEDLAKSLDDALRAKWTPTKEHIGFLVQYIRKLFQANSEYLPSEDQIKNFLAMFAQELRGASLLHLSYAFKGTIGNKNIDDTGLSIRLEIDKENNILFQTEYKDQIFMSFDGPLDPQTLDIYQTFCLTKAGEVIPMDIIIETDAELLNEKCKQLKKEMEALGIESPTTKALTSVGLWPQKDKSSRPSRVSWPEAASAQDEQKQAKRSASR